VARSLGRDRLFGDLVGADQELPRPQSGEVRLKIRMEEKLEAKVFGDEWRKLKEDRPRGWGGGYIEFNVVERVVPIVFVVLYLVVFLKVVL
jgi:hypothetical protein